MIPVLSFSTESVRYDNDDQNDHCRLFLFQFATIIIS